MAHKPSPIAAAVAVIHPAVPVAQKLTLTTEDIDLLRVACKHQDIANESWSTVANRYYNIGFRAEHLRSKGGDEEIINIVDNALILTMSEFVQDLFSKKPSELNAANKLTRKTCTLDLNKKRGYLRDALDACDVKAKAGEAGETPPTFGEVQAAKLKAIITAIRKAPADKLDFQVTVVTDLLELAIGELT
jgi:hypothetical protein